MPWTGNVEFEDGRGRLAPLDKVGQMSGTRLPHVRHVSFSSFFVRRPYFLIGFDHIHSPSVTEMLHALLRLALLCVNVLDTFKIVKAPKVRKGQTAPSVRALLARKRDMKGMMCVWIVSVSQMSTPMLLVASNGVEPTDMLDLP